MFAAAPSRLASSSSTLCRGHAVELTASERSALHGQTLGNTHQLSTSAEDCVRQFGRRRRKRRAGKSWLKVTSGRARALSHRGTGESVHGECVFELGGHEFDCSASHSAGAQGGAGFPTKRKIAAGRHQRLRCAQVHSSKLCAGPIRSNYRIALATSQSRLAVPVATLRKCLHARRVGGQRMQRVHKRPSARPNALPSPLKSAKVATW
ncbi:hypothetical protein L1887_62039 [Cichorium endivia]|nr:hypothetical protein L1887_62039 [Cichorium endivia]